MEHYLIAMGVTAGIYAIMALGMNVIWGNFCRDIAATQAERRTLD